MLSDGPFSKSLGLKETHIEDFLRKNIGLIFEDDDETLLIVGQQVVNNSGGRNDLVAIDSNGNLVLIEINKIRRGPGDSIRTHGTCKQFATPQAWPPSKNRYIKANLFAHYINKQLAPEEFGRRKVKEFLKKNKAENTFNGDQRWSHQSSTSNLIRELLDVQKRN